MLDGFKKKMNNWLADLDRKYPNRHKVIHKACCKHCPSASGHDPETQGIADRVPKHIIATEYTFVCAWRTSKLCKGYCDLNGIDQQYLNNIYKP